MDWGKTNLDLTSAVGIISQFSKDVNYSLYKVLDLGDGKFAIRVEREKLDKKAQQILQKLIEEKGWIITESEKHILITLS